MKKNLKLILAIKKDLAVCYYHVTYALQSESKLNSCLSEYQGTSCSKEAGYLRFK